MTPEEAVANTGLPKLGDRIKGQIVVGKFGAREPSDGRYEYRVCVVLDDPRWYDWGNADAGDD